MNPSEVHVRSNVPRLVRGPRRRTRTSSIPRNDRTRLSTTTSFAPLLVATRRRVWKAHMASSRHPRRSLRLRAKANAPPSPKTPSPTKPKRRCATPRPSSTTPTRGVAHRSPGYDPFADRRLGRLVRIRDPEGARESVHWTLQAPTWRRGVVSEAQLESNTGRATGHYAVCFGSFRDWRHALETIEAKERCGELVKWKTVNLSHMEQEGTVMYEDPSETLANDDDESGPA